MLPYLDMQIGDVAQLGERGVRNAEVRGSIPLISTIFHITILLLFQIFPILRKFFYSGPIKELDI